MNTLLDGIDVLFGIFIALLSCWGFLYENKAEQYREWFRIKWLKISMSAWVELPEIIIKWTSNREERLYLYITKLIANKVFIFIVLYFSPILIASGLLKYFGFKVGMIILLLLCVSVYCIKFIHKYFRDDNDYIVFYSAFIGIIFFLTGFLWLSISVRWQTYIFLFFMLFLSLFLWYGSILVGISLIFSKAKKWQLSPSFNNNDYLDVSNIHKLISFGYAIPISIIWTIFAIFIGHLILPNGWMPQSLQMMFSNVLFDTITIIFVVYILSYAVNVKKKYAIPIAIIFIIMLSTIFAWLSLYSGVVFSNNSLSLKEVTNVLMARSINGNDYYFGPCFWVMHTAFIPVVLFLLLVFVAWMAKIVSCIFQWFFGKGKDCNPIKLTIVLVTLLYSIYKAVLYVAKNIIEGS